MAELDEARIREAHIRAINALVIRLALEFCIVALVCFLGTAIVVLALQK